MDTTALDRIARPHQFEPPGVEPGGCVEGQPCRHGLLKKFTDANGVVTEFEYDPWGQLSAYSEGRNAAGAPVYRINVVKDAKSRQVESFWECASSGGTTAVASGGGSSGTYVRSHDPDGGQTSCTLKPSYRGAENGGTATAAAQVASSGFPILPCAEPALPDTQISTSADYDGAGRVAEEYQRFKTNREDSYRQTLFEYNELGALTARDSWAQELPWWMQVRRFGYPMDVLSILSGTALRTGPDGVLTTRKLDSSGREISMVRGPEDAPLMSSGTTYNARGLVSTVTYGNGTAVAYTYDGAERVTRIDHQSADGALLSMLYTYDVRGLPSQIAEEVNYQPDAMVSFDYDARGRLTGEKRTGSSPYDFSYAYDLGGNRTTKTNNLSGEQTRYTYDVSNIVAYGSANNRLMKAETFAAAGATVPLSSTFYYYNCSGNPDHIVTHPSGTDVYTATRFGYADDEQTAAYVVGETWRWDGASSCEVPESFQIDYGREFRYDGDRRRYLSRRLRTSALMSGWAMAESMPRAWGWGSKSDDLWSDYDGDQIYGDFWAMVIDGNTLGPVVWDHVEPGVATLEEGHTYDAYVTGERHEAYTHGDTLGTLRATSAADGTAETRPVYTAFGERVGGPWSRYGFVGASGYQASPEFPFLHVGARYYDPALGRFLQRDPIGIGGGANAYGYVGNQPTGFVDPSGLDSTADDSGIPSQLQHWLDAARRAAKACAKSLAKAAATGGRATGGGLGGVVTTPVQALEAGPDLYRITYAMRERERLMRELECEMGGGDACRRRGGS
jgi:RHS repeat-associated protein